MAAQAITSPIVPSQTIFAQVQRKFLSPQPRRIARECGRRSAKGLRCEQPSDSLPSRHHMHGRRRDEKAVRLVPRQQARRGVRVARIVGRRRVCHKVPALEGAGDHTRFGLSGDDKPLQDMPCTIKHIDAAAQTRRFVCRKDKGRFRQPKNRVERITHLNPQTRPPCLALPGESQAVAYLVRQMFQHAKTPQKNDSHAQ